MFDFTDVVFIVITLFSVLMFLGPFLIAGALIYFGLFKKKKTPIGHSEQRYTQYDNVFRYDPSYMKVSKPELILRIIQYSMMAVAMIVMPITMTFGFKVDVTLSNGVPIPVAIGLGVLAVCGIVCLVTGHIADLMKRVRMAEYMGKRFF